MIRKLVSKKDLKKKQRRNQYILASILVFILFGSVFGIIAGSFGKSSSTKKISYNGLDFLQENGYYVLTIGDAKFYFLENPHSVANFTKKITVSKTFKDFLLKPLYIYSDNPVISAEIHRNLNVYVQRIQPACLKEEECLNNDWPIKTCQENFIFIRTSDKNKIYEKDNCIFIEGRQEDLTKLTDGFLFQIIGINQ